ncbi:hypothetical protein H4219_000563 [Mycoemilia scoparia]|uniref:PHD-type domain-containing protein n=1 Tax=Mycoemilia scoparia TaxID=417184 RepID=A0A9W8A2N6_9FUNG|nr:hypothetical protein H4219_000563 [Mycoemilia scoparia]
MPRLNLRDFIDEPLASRIRPVLQSYCQECQSGDSFVDNTLVQCDGCHRAYHQDCYSGTIPTSVVSDGSKWYCNKSCQDNLKKQKIYVELPKKRLPFMCASKHSNSHQSDKAKSAASGGQAGLQNKNTSTTTPGYRSRKRIAKSSSSDDMAASQPRAKIRKSTRASRSSTKQQRQG